MSPYETEEFKTKIVDDYYKKNLLEELGFNKTFLEFLGCLNTNSEITANACLLGYGAIEFSVTGESLGELIDIISKALMLRESKSIHYQLNC